jgi:hypothetical protein
VEFIAPAGGDCRAAFTASSARCKHRASFGQKRTTRFRQARRLGAAFQKQKAEFILQIADLSAHAGCDTWSFSAARETFSCSATPMK